jgi:glycosyltransferase involved in cell wall biosynthesis
MPASIVFFNRSFYPEISATSQLLTELCIDLVKDYGCKVTVISGKPLISENPNSGLNPGLNLIKQDNFKNINVLRVNNTNFSPKSLLRRVSNYLTYFILSFIASFKLKKADLVVTLTDPPIICIVGLWVSYRFRAPLVISVRDIFPEAARGLDNSGGKVIDFFLDGINRFCLKKASHIVSLGKLMQRRLIEEKGVKENRVSIISDWADSRNFFPVSRHNPFACLNNLTDFFVVMYSGNMGASSGLETLIESALILKDYKDILFVFIGEGIIKDELIERAREYKLDNTKFFPYQPLGKLSNSFSSADMFVIPLKKGLAGYSIPSKIYPILASGKPYVASVEEESEIAAITKEFNCGLIAKPQDSRDLAQKILILYKNKDLRIKLGENSRHASGFFDRPKGTKAYYGLFKKLLDHKKNI